MKSDEPMILTRASGIETEKKKCLDELKGTRGFTMRPPSSVIISSTGETLKFDFDQNLIEDASYLFQSTTDPSKVMKALPLNRQFDEGFSGFCQERAILIQLSSDIPEIPKVYPVHYDWRQVNRYIIMDNAGSQDLYSWMKGVERGASVLANILSEKPVVDDNRTLAQIAIRVISILQRVHSFGVVHGNIDQSNFIVGVRSHPVESLKLVGFGEAQLFIDPQTGEHKEEQHVKLINPWAAGGPWRLLEPNKISRSRRDDMVDAARMLMKMQEILSPRADKKVLAQFYKAMKALAFEDEPDYAHWIGIFRKAESENRL